MSVLGWITNGCRTTQAQRSITQKQSDSIHVTEALRQEKYNAQQELRDEEQMLILEFAPWKTTFSHSDGETADTSAANRKSESPSCPLQKLTLHRTTHLNRQTLTTSDSSKQAESFAQQKLQNQTNTQSKSRPLFSGWCYGLFAFVWAGLLIGYYYLKKRGWLKF